MDDHDLAIKFSKFKIAEPIWEWQVWEKVNYDQIWYTGVFEVADHDLAIIHSTL